jgi:hypothetical protein
MNGFTVVCLTHHVLFQIGIAENIFVGGILSIPSACFNMFLAKTVFPEFTQRHYKYRCGGFQFD